MGLTTLLRGFKVPITILDRFLTAHNVPPTEHNPPHFFRGLGGLSAATQNVDPQSALLRTRLAAANPAALGSVRLFVPHRRGQDPSAYGYVAYAFVMVFGQREVDLGVELPEQAPLGFAALRREVLGFAGGCGDARAGGGEQVFLWWLPMGSDLRCQQCVVVFETLPALHIHKSELHGVDMMSNPLPDDL
ncbi:predicted protein [Chaetomium globosum CBS 148.51]|uniref:C2H2-type domain-containing protein n=1 Tax=Chaetomium globosum (strain ATCC 6205 / CBS 148.51 / DSM 1962 / NBRC 6347 / NRRL 1970) TaxID=306901 RepID=Q2H1I7_CHAGB|nr:uncharacterized protein CHGG_04359 [Chaetomium globosum CBS 148.51]EAQ87740.1 predicted protein [Chaetomium globosum CBS 148.51]